MKKILIIGTILIILGLILGLFWWTKNNQTTGGDQSLNNIKKSGKLTIGVDYSYGVMEFFNSNNQAAGIDIELGKEIARRLGVEVEFKQFDWQNLFTVIENREVDLIMSSLTITPDRAKRILFSAPYFNGGQVILVRADNSNINAVTDLKNKKIGVQIDTTSQEEAKKITADNLIITYASWDNPLEPKGIIYDLKAKKFDAIIVDYIQAVDSVQKDPEIKIIGSPFTQEYYGIATNLNNAALMEAINNALRDIKKDGTLTNIENKFIKS